VRMTFPVVIALWQYDWYIFHVVVLEHVRWLLLCGNRTGLFFMLWSWNMWWICLAWMLWVIMF